METTTGGFPGGITGGEWRWSSRWREAGGVVSGWEGEGVVDPVVYVDRVGGLLPPGVHGGGV